MLSNSETHRDQTTDDIVGGLVFIVETIVQTADELILLRKKLRRRLNVVEGCVTAYRGMTDHYFHRQIAESRKEIERQEQVISNAIGNLKTGAYRGKVDEYLEERRELKDKIKLVGLQLENMKLQQTINRMSAVRAILGEERVEELVKLGILKFGGD